MNLVKNGAVLLATLGMFAATSCGPKSQTLTLEKAKDWLKNVDKESLAKTVIDKQNFNWKFTAQGEGMTPKEPNAGFVQYMIANYVDAKKAGTSSDFLKSFKDLSGNIDHITDSMKEQPLTEINKTYYCFDAERLQKSADDSDLTNKKYILVNNKLHFKFDTTVDTPFEKEGETKTIELSMDETVEKNGTVSSIGITLAKQDVKGTSPLKVDGSFSGTIKQTMTYKTNE